MKLLFVTHGFPRHTDDSAGAFLLTLARGQQDLGHEVMVVAPHDPGVPMTDTVAGVSVQRYRYGPDAAETLAYAGTMHEQVLRSWRARWRLLALLRAQRRAVNSVARSFLPDVIHVHWWFPGGLAVWPVKRGHPPFVVTSHGTDLFMLDRFPRARILAKRIFRRASGVTVISSPLVPRVTALGVPAEQVTIIPMPLTADLFTPPAIEEQARDPDQLLFVGRLVERKGAEFAVRALALLRDRGRSVSLAIVGDGPERNALERLADELGVREAVRFAGMVAPSEVSAYYRRAAVMLMPAVTDWKGEQEGFGMVLVEAMLSGLPVVATVSGGIPDVIEDGVTGVLVPERDPEALADAVLRFLDDTALALIVGRNAVQAVERRFAPDAIARRHEAVYRAAAGET